MSATIADVLEGRARWTVICADCLSILPTLPPKSVAHVITDPPYEAEAHTKARRSLRGGGSPRRTTGGAVRAIDAPLEISFSAITEDQRSACGREFGRLAQRWVLSFCQAEAVWLWREALSTGLDWVRAGVWVKPNGAPQFTGDRPGQGFESIAIAHAPGRKHWNGGGRHAVWTHVLEKVVPAGGGSEKSEHPTMKPVELMLELVELFTDPGDVVLDPFAGSGTTGAACLRLGRRFIGIEKDARYAALAQERLEAESHGLTLRDARAGQLSLLEGR